MLLPHYKRTQALAVATPELTFDADSDWGYGLTIKKCQAMIENIIYNNQTVAKYNSSKENPFVSIESPEECHIISGIFFCNCSKSIFHSFRS